ncbi:hypothetical protein MACH26_26930 [Planctobacterium marinum]|uniref:Uncharacterized protein n=1 Tax=Planctobacterium marinum TaxID=1631968 RepID=A0AA48KSI5_9ALTE|nr:hypothetical protein MACH26_26930 [Planctobacterium marinum]
MTDIEFAHGISPYLAMNNLQADSVRMQSNLLNSGRYNAQNNHNIVRYNAQSIIISKNSSTPINGSH